MAEKKKQHLVPKVYLKGFLTDPREEMLKNPYFEPGIFVNNALLNEGWRHRGLDNGVFTRSYYYNLDYDDPKQPIIENYLAAVEGQLKKYLEQIYAGNIDNEVLSFFSFYTVLQYMRVESHIDNFQGIWNQVAETMDLFQEDGSSYKDAFKDLAKKQLASADFGDVIHDDAHIIYNETNFPFVTSDNPVVRRQVNICDMKKLFPANHLIACRDEGQEVPLFFFPLSPKIAYVSSPLFKPDLGMKFSLKDLMCVFYLNIESILNASKEIYSSIKEPIKGEMELSRYIQSRKCEHFYVKIYGNSKRIILKLIDIREGKNSVHLFVEDPGLLSPFESGDELTSFEVIRNRVSIRGMRQCQIASIDHKKGSLKIKSKFKI